MRRAVQRRSMRLAARGPGAFSADDSYQELAGHLIEASAPKPGWRARNWIMSQEWFDVCLKIRWRTEDPGILYGVPISVSERADFPRIERYVRTG